MSLIGKEIGDFSAQAFQNNSFKTVNREDLRGKWSVFFFYPADFTFVCRPSSKTSRTTTPRFRRQAARSTRSPATPTLFTRLGTITPRRSRRSPIPMLADPTQALARDFEVLIPEAGLAERGTFIVDPDLKIVAYEVNAGNVGRNAEELLRKVQACQFVREHGDEVCPAKWTPGAETLKPSLDLVGAL